MDLKLWYFAAFLIAPTLATTKDIEHCDPSDKDEHCPPDPGFASKTTFDFTDASWDDKFEDFWTVDEDSTNDKRRVDFDGDEDGVALGIWEGDAATSLTSKKYLFFGKVSVEVQAAEGQGVVTKIMLKSDSGDEIDWEILGANDNEAQTNYFHDGDAEFNKYNDTYEVSSSVFSEAHTYTLEWTQEKIAFSIDGKERNKKYIGDIPPEKWPHAPMHVALSIWAVGETDYPGVDEWAGGLPKWDDEPFKAYFRRVDIEDYTGYCKEIDGKVEYAYNERMVDWHQVTVRGCRYKQQGILTPHVPSGGDLLPTDTSGGYPEPTGGDSTQTSSDPDSTSREDETTGGTADGPMSTGGDEAPPQETQGGDEDAATMLFFQIWPMVAGAVVAGSMVML